jgi:hypothetical protein
MEKLLEQILQRWEQAFDELEELPDHKAQVKMTQYADGLRYDLAKFGWNSFPADGSMTENKEDIDPRNLHEYGFNAQGRPCYVTFGHDHNQLTWEGFYSYSDTLVEYVEYCLSSGVPSVLVRLEFREGRKLSLQRVMVNGRGSVYFLSHSSKEAIVNKIRTDGFTLIATVTGYDYSPKGRVEKASSIHISPGIGRFSSHDEYTYDENEALDTIRTYFDKGTNRLSYCRLAEDMIPESLMESLAEAMALSVSKALADQGLEQPITLLELNYHYADNYIPLLVWQTAGEVEERLANNEFDFHHDAYHNSPQVEILPFERLFAQLEQMMEERDETDLGRVMLTKAASLLTKNKLFGQVRVSHEFTAFAIDWSIEGHSDEEIEQILRECGMEEEVAKIWKQKGMLPNDL